MSKKLPVIVGAFVLLFVLASMGDAQTAKRLVIEELEAELDD